MSKKLININEDTKMILGLEAVRNGTNLQNYIEALLDAKAKKIQKELNLTIKK